MRLRRKHERDQGTAGKPAWLALDVVAGQAPVIRAERAGDLVRERQVA